MRDGFACYGSTEIWNTCRTLHYVDTLFPQHGYTVTVRKDGDTMCCGCCDGTYETPEIDEAPWYDENHDESIGFYGIIPTEIVGLSYNPTSRSVTPGFSGASIGQRSEAGRTITVTALAYADSCEAMAYGVNWLNATLEGSCGMSGFNWLNCCPDESGSDAQANAIRYIPCATLTEGVVAEDYEVETFKGLIAEVDFTITAEASWVYDAPTVLVDEEMTYGGNDFGTVCATFTPDCTYGAAIEVLIDRRENSGVAENNEIRFLANETRYLGSGNLNLANARYGATFEARPGDSVFVNTRCSRILMVNPTGHALGPYPSVTLTPYANGLFPVAGYGEEWKVCVRVKDNGDGPVRAIIKAYPRRRF